MDTEDVIVVIIITTCIIYYCYFFFFTEAIVMHSHKIPFVAEITWISGNILV